MEQNNMSIDKMNLEQQKEFYELEIEDLEEVRWHIEEVKKFIKTLVKDYYGEDTRLEKLMVKTYRNLDDVDEIADIRIANYTKELKKLGQ